MKHLRTSLIAIGTISALLLFAGNTSATTLTSPTGTVATPTIKAESEGHVVIGNAIANIECNWSFEGFVSFHSAGNEALVPLTSVTPAGCTNSWHVTVGAVGALAVDWTIGYRGTVRSTGLTLTTTRFGVTCTYLTNNTKLGTLTGGSPATIHLEGAIPIHTGSSFLCGSSSGALTGAYQVATPGSLFVDKDGTSLTSPTGTASAPTIKATSEEHVVFSSAVANIECNWSFEGTAEGASVGKPIGIALTNIELTNCTGIASHATFVARGRLEIDWTSGYNGTVIWTGATLEWTGKGFNCNYATNQTELGTITGGNPATIHIAMQLPLHSGSVFCLNGSSSTPVSGSFKITSPSSLFVDPL